MVLVWWGFALKPVVTPHWCGAMPDDDTNTKVGPRTNTILRTRNKVENRTKVGPRTSSILGTRTKVENHTIVGARTKVGPRPKVGPRTIPTWCSTVVIYRTRL